MNLDPLAFWQLYQSQLPKLSKCAKLVLAIPAQSAASERVFSSLTNTCTKSRSSLDAELTADLVLSSIRYRVELRNKKSIARKFIEFPLFKQIPLDFVHRDYDLEIQEADDDYNPEEDDDTGDDEDGDDGEYDEETAPNPDEVVPGALVLVIPGNRRR